VNDRGDLSRVRGHEHFDAGKRRHDRDVLERVVRIALAAIGEAAADRDDLDVGAMVADVVPELLEAPQRREIADRVGEDHLATEGEPGGDAGHVLLGNADIEIAAGKLLREALEHREAEVAADQPEARIGLGKRLDRGDERRPHRAITSAIAAASWSTPGDR
jgi:hypothetical protein